MYNNPYMQGYTPNYTQQNINERIDNQIAQLQQMKEQIKSNNQPAINQTFQLAPTNNHTMRYANTLEDVSKEIVYLETPFFSKDMSVLWIKNAKGEIKTYELNEIIPKDSKDIQIEYLQSQIEELKGKIENDAVFRNADEKQNSTNTSTDDDTNGTKSESVKSSSVQKIPRGKTK